MTAEATTPYDWLKQVPTSLLALNGFPLKGSSLPFPFEAFSKQLSNLLQFNVTVKPAGEWQMRQAGAVLEGLPKESDLYSFTFSGLEGTCACVFSHQDAALALSALIDKQPTDLVGLDKDTLLALNDFLVAAAVASFSNIPFDKELQPRWTRGEKLEEEPALTLDIALSFKERLLSCRFIAPKTVLDAWRARHSARSLDLLKDTALAEKIDAIIHVEAGKTSLTKQEWSSLKPGDFLMLDLCSLTLDDDKKGRVMLTIQGMPFFRAKLRADTLKLLEHPLNYEVDASMPDESSGKSLFSDNESDEHSLFDMDTDDSLFNTTEESQYTEETAADEESFSDIESSAETTEEESTVSESMSGAPGKSPLQAEELVLPIVIEVGRIQMPIQKVLELQPGAVLETDLSPENGVDLVIHGKRVAKGELIKIGESIGVRILDI